MNRPKPVPSHRSRSFRPRSGHAARRIAGCGLVVLSIFGGIGCAARPARVPGWDDLEATNFRVEADERALWNEAAESIDELRKEGRLLEDESLTLYLQGVVARLVPPTSEQAPEIRVVVFKSTEGNASAQADGTILFDLPLLASIADEAQTAFILAHEIAHILRRHSLITTRYRASTPSHVLRMALSREHEAEADRVAVALLEAAGYDARVAPGALHHLQFFSQSSGGSKHPWSSHAPIRQRARTVRKAVDRLGTTGGARNYDEFQRAMDPVRLDAALLQSEADHYDAALALVRLHLQRDPRSARAHLLRARILIEKDPSTRGSDAVGADLRAAVEYAPNDPESLRALGLHLRDAGDREGSNAILRRYLEAAPDAFDRKLIERYVGATDP